MGDETVHICEACWQIVDPSASGIVHAVEVQHVRTFGSDDAILGLGVYFHEAHFPHGDPRYRLDPTP